LISTGKFDAGGSVLIIEPTEKDGKIMMTENYNIYRIGKPATKFTYSQQILVSTMALSRHSLLLNIIPIFFDCLSIDAIFIIIIFLFL
jgi:hypothetical protein